MKLRLPLAAMLVAGCGHGGAGHLAVFSAPRKITPIRLVKEIRLESNSKLDGIDYEWDLGGREYKEIVCSGITSTSGVHPEGPLQSKLKVSLRAGASGRVNFLVYLDQKEGETHTGSSTDFTTGIVGGVKGVQRTPDEKLTGQNITLLAWKASDGSRPPALKIEFR